MYEDCKTALVTCPLDQVQQKQGEARAYLEVSKLLTRTPIKTATE